MKEDSMLNDEEKMRADEKKLKEELLEIYEKNKKAFIDAEETAAEMRFFAAPTLEHRDALEHIMRYMERTKDGNITRSALKELENAKGHEVRAYYDVVDYYSILVRDDINQVLQRVSNRKIRKNWKEYSDVKTTMYDMSEKIKNVRKQKRNDMEVIEKYEEVFEYFHDQHKQFINEILPMLNSK